MGVLGVAVWPVGGEHDVVITYIIDDLLDEVFIGLHRDKTLALKILTRLSGNDRIGTPQGHLIVLVEPSQQEGYPAAVAL
jgi:hypothetical protein